MDCLKPKGIKNVKTGESIRVRCGRCLPCQRLRAGEWTIRLKEQMKTSAYNWFITLTLDDDNLTWALDRPTLVRRDVQLFMKKLRKKLDHKIKFYAVGEYGSQTKRPHYHMILFNTGVEKSEVMAYLCSDAWQKGFVHVGSVTEASIRYVSGYLEKGMYGESPSEEVQREFNQMSKGLGINYINHTKKYHQENQKIEYSLGGGDFVKLPRYYTNKIFSESQREEIYKKLYEARAVVGPKDEELKRQFIINRLNAINNLKQKRK